MADFAEAKVPTTETPALAPEAEAAPQVPEKFRNPDGSINNDALLRSYLELEKAPKRAQEAATEAATEDATEEQPEVEMEAEVSNALTEAGLDPVAFTNEFQTRGDGTLSDESMKALEEKGYPPEMVRTYLKGLQADAASAAAEAERFYEETIAIAGGEEQFNDMIAWSARQDPSVYKGYNEALSANDPVRLKAEAAKMFKVYAASEGAEPVRRVEGGSRPSKDVFNSMAEFSAAMSAARRSKDPARIREVEAKAVRSPAL